MEQKIYMDHAATTYVRKEVLDEMAPFFCGAFGNPSSMHAFGREARSAINTARRRVAKALNADDKEIYFTSGGTESDNWAVKGAAWANRQKGKHIITTAVEHHAVLDSCKYLAQNGFELTFLPVDEFCRVTAEQVAGAVREDTVLISVMTANNEVGTRMPIAEIGQIARERGILFHTDAVQAAGHMLLDVKAFGADLLTLSAHKFYGPKGVGALYIRKGSKIEKYLHGGSQEQNRRATTENTPGVVGMGRALELAAGGGGSRKCQAHGAEGQAHPRHPGACAGCAAERASAGPAAGQRQSFVSGRGWGSFADPTGYEGHRGILGLGMHLRLVRSFLCAAGHGPAGGPRQKFRAFHAGALHHGARYRLHH